MMINNTALGFTCMASIINLLIDNYTIAQIFFINNSAKINIVSNSYLVINGNITIQNSAEINNDGVVKISGNFNNSATFNQTAGVFEFNGTTAQTITGANVWYYLTINNSSGGVTVSSGVQKIKHTLTLSNGLFNVSADSMILLSDINRTARIAEITNGDITGNITMQRYVPAGNTSWRQLCTAVSGQTLVNWYDDFAMCGFTGVPTSCGNFISVYTYDEMAIGIKENGWTAADNVTNSIPVGKGFMCYVGDGFVTTNSIYIDVTGPANKGLFNLPVTFTNTGSTADDGWNLVANPYPSSIDWDATSGWTKTNLNDAVYIWNADLQIYASYVNGVGTNNGSRYVPSSQAFWVQANVASPALIITEPVKSSQDVAFLKTAAGNAILRIKVFGYGYEDEAVLCFSDSATFNFDKNYDAYNISHTTYPPDISTVVSDTIDLSINTLPEPDSVVVIPLKIIVKTSGYYTITTQEIETLPENWCLFLQNSINNEVTDLKINNSYTFSLSDTVNSPAFNLYLINSANTDCYSYWSSLHNTSGFQDIDVITIFPNPTNDFINIQFLSSEESNAEITISNTLSQKVLNKKITIQKGLSNYAFNVSALAKGVYTIKVFQNNYTTIDKLVIN